MARYALLMGGYKIHRHEPFYKWKVGVLEDCSHKAREIPSAMLATETAVRAFHAMMTATIRANGISVSPSRLDDGFLADVVIRKVGYEGNEIVEV